MIKGCALQLNSFLLIRVTLFEAIRFNVVCKIISLSNLDLKVRPRHLNAHMSLQLEI